MKGVDTIVYYKYYTIGIATLSRVEHKVVDKTLLKRRHNYDANTKVLMLDE